MGVHQWHVQAGHSQLWLSPLPTLVGRGSHSEGHRVKYGGKGGRSWGWREDRTLIPPSCCLMYACLTNKQTPDSRCQSLNLIQVGFQTTPASRTAMCFFAESRPTNQMPLSATLLICMTLGAPHYNIYTQATRKTKQLTDAINSFSALLFTLLYSVLTHCTLLLTPLLSTQFC